MERDWAVASIGPAFLASIARQHGHEIDIIHVSVDDTAEALCAQVMAYSPDVLALANLKTVAASQSLREPHSPSKIHPDHCRGPSPHTFAPESVLEQPGFDYVCLGEGEGAFIDSRCTWHAGLHRRRADRQYLGQRWSPPQASPALRPY